MARVLQIRRGTTAQNDNFTGMAGEITFDTDAKTLRVHDGETLGGFALARADTTSGGGTTGGGDFDISDVPAEFWQQLFAQYCPAPFTIMDSTLVNIPTSGGTQYIFETSASAKFVQTFLVCQTPEAGYAIGDTVSAFGIGNQTMPAPNTFTDSFGLNILLLTGGQAFWVAHKNTGVQTQITNERWRILFRVYC